MNLVIKMMLAHNAMAGWEFECPGPEIPALPAIGHPHPDGSPTSRPCWVAKAKNDAMVFESQLARGIVFPP